LSPAEPGKVPNAKSPNAKAIPMQKWFSRAFCRSLLAGDPERWTGLSLRLRQISNAKNPNPKENPAETWFSDFSFVWRLRFGFWSFSRP
jgi:hypothetical protein